MSTKIVPENESMYIIKEIQKIDILLVQKMREKDED